MKNPTKTGPKKSSIDRQDTKKRILLAASGIFAEKGFRDTTIQDICNAAGANVAAVNYHFGSKKNLYNEVWRAASEIAKQGFLRALAQITDPEERLTAIIHQRIKQTFDDGPAGQLRKLAFSEMGSPTDDHDELVRKFLRPFRDLLAKTVSEILGIKEQSPIAQRCAFSLHSQLVFLNVLRMRDKLHHLDFLSGSSGKPSDEHIEALSDHISTFVMGGIKATSDSKQQGKMKLHATKAVISLSLASVLCSCTMMRPRVDLQPPEELPPSYSVTSTNSTPAKEWWKTFESPELNELISLAFSNNPSLAQTAARFRQARASAKRASAASIPSLTATAGVAQSEGEQTGQDKTASDVSRDSYSLGLAASYELDLWGRVYSIRNSAGQNAQASFLDLETATMSLSARIAELWIQIIEAEGRLLLVSKQIDTNRKTLNLLKQRATKSNTSLLDVYQQEQLLSTSETKLPPAKQALELLSNELAVLLGRHAGTVPPITTRSLPDIPPFPGSGVPADLLENRPDIQAQQHRLEAAGWDMASARADRLPAIRLTAKYEYTSDRASTLFDNWLSSLAAGLTAPLIDGGQKRSEVERTQAALDESLARYREVILAAFKDVQDSLIREQRTGETVLALTRQLESSRKALEEASRKYRNGNTGYLSVFTALRATYETEQTLLAAQSALLQARVALHRALGGTWTQDAAQAAADKGAIKTAETID